MDTPVPEPTLIIELADDPRLARDVAAGRVFVPGCALAAGVECALVVRGPTEEIELPARVVFVDAQAGATLELVGFSSCLRDHLTQLMAGWLAALAGAGDVRAAPAPPGDVSIEATPTDAPSPTPPDAAEPAPDAREDAVSAPGADATLDGDADAVADTPEPDPERRRLARNYYERLRGLTVAQQIKAAHSADPQERIVLERLYNKTVWEPLLRNPRLTPPEVARMARLGTLPRVLLEIIVGNGAWLQAPEVRRALLTNPRLGTDQILRVLRLLPKHELKLAAVQTAYPNAVRDAARRLIKD